MLQFTEYTRTHRQRSRIGNQLISYRRAVLDPVFKLIKAPQLLKERSSLDRDLRSLHRHSRDIREEQINKVARQLENLFIRQILSEVDFDKTIDGGFKDPFGLIDPKHSNYKWKSVKPRSEPKKIPDLLKLDLLERKAAAFNKGGISNKIPKAIHVIWMGGPFTENRGHTQVATWKNPGAVPTRFLWTDLDRQTIKAKRKQNDKQFIEMENFCNQYKFTLLCVDEIFNTDKPMHLQGIFNLLRLQHEWAAASDVLRYELLYRFGGIYADTDVACVGKINFREVKALPQSETHRFGMGQMDGALGKSVPAQAVLFSTPDNPVLKAILDYIKNSFSKSATEVLKTTGHRVQVAPNYTSRRMAEILARTGPTAFYVSVLLYFLGKERKLSDIFKRAKDALIITDQRDWEMPHEIFYGVHSEDILHDLTAGNLSEADRHMLPSVQDENILGFLKSIGVGKDKLKIGSEASWIGVRRIPCKNIEDAKAMLTALLFRLRADPTVLDLIPFEVTDSSRSLITEVLEILIQGYRQTLDDVKVSLVSYVARQSDISDTANKLIIREARDTLIARNVREALFDIGFTSYVSDKSDEVDGIKEPLGVMSFCKRIAF